MKVIPVIDLLNGVVVHAKQGHRDSYRPIRSVLCSESTASDVVSSLVSEFYFDTVYIADLNSITKKSDNTQLILQLLGSFPDIQFWVDQGFPVDPELSTAKNFMPVIGSESIASNTLCELRAVSMDYILSLDFLLSNKLGSEALFHDASMWPEKVIIMKLSKVGSNSGPDIELLKCYRENWPNTTFVAAGGVRDKEDLVRLKRIGIDFTLVASALHSGKLQRSSLAII